MSARTAAERVLGTLTLGTAENPSGAPTSRGNGRCCVVCGAETHAPRPWCLRPCRARIRALGRAALPDATGREQMSAGLVAFKSGETPASLRRARAAALLDELARLG